jgi:hypothetical protein
MDTGERISRKVLDQLIAWKIVKLRAGRPVLMKDG